MTCRGRTSCFATSRQWRSWWAPDPLLLRQPDLAHDLDQSLRVAFQELLELRAVHVRDLAARGDELRDDGLVLHEGADRIAQDLDDMARRLAWGEHAGPQDVEGFRISRLRQRRHLGEARQALG